MAERWGADQDEAFDITTGDLTTTYTDNQKEAYLDQVQQFILLVHYTKGTETYIKIQIETTNQYDGVLAKVYYKDSKMDMNTQAVSTTELILSATDNYRLPIPVSVQEDWARVSVKDDVAGTGTVTLRSG